MGNRKNRGWITKHGKDDEGYAKYRDFAAGKGRSKKFKTKEEYDNEKKLAAAKEEREAVEAAAKEERDAIAAAAAIEKQEREAAEVASQAERDAIAAAAAIEKQEREDAAAAETAARLAAEAAALLDRDAIADEVTAKALQSQNERDQLFEVSRSIYMSENQVLGYGSLDSITLRSAGDPYYIDDNYDPANDTHLYVDNVAIGYRALFEHTKPINTIAIGGYSQENAIYDAAHDGTDPANPYNFGNRNVSVGFDTLQLSTTGVMNTALGYRTLPRNTTGNHNVGIGVYTLVNNTTSWGNVAIGSNASASGTVYGQNTAVGYQSLYYNTSGQNTAFGYKSGYGISSGYYNTVIGAQVANTSSITGINNIIIGYTAEPSSSGVSNEITFGNSSISNIRCQVQNISGLSDSRDKAEITDIPEDAGLQFIDKLRPVTFYWDMREWYSDNTSDGSKMNKVHSNETPNSGQRMGFIAQEVLEVVNDYKYIKESGMVSESNPEKLELALGSLVTPLVKAVQQLSEQNKELLNRITILEQK